ncbi:U-box domain-containing protein 51 [Camellia lanceoleosa]|uniref:U-box domain-containing protein 51 n=1 Tax=Camellia lanceoleosa TaxID=1840588 RepID=A0ACC0H853_9ERIC|nr:U-box domain-containing protein 51 [Camellia lanceoleosa]
MVVLTSHAETWKYKVMGNANLNQVAICASSMNGVSNCSRDCHRHANILLDHNYVSKISDVGLARLVPPSVADDVTQYRMTSTAGTFCYIDPEYQQTGMLGIKSDVYSPGIMLLQLIIAKLAMGLAHQVGRSIEKGTFVEMLDPTVPDWPIKEALCFAKIAVQWAELRRKDRPDLGKVVMLELDRLREFESIKSDTKAADTAESNSIPMPESRLSDPKTYTSISNIQFKEQLLLSRAVKATTAKVDMEMMAQNRGNGKMSYKEKKKNRTYD